MVEPSTTSNTGSDQILAKSDGSINLSWTDASTIFDVVLTAEIGNGIGGSQYPGYQITTNSLWAETMVE
jgi:hypothetical protein